MKKVCVVVSSPMTVKAFLRHQLRLLAERYKVDVVANGGSRESLGELPESIRVMHEGIAREIRPWSDMKALAGLARLFRNERYDLVQSYTPKAGLLAMAAGALSGVPIRVHTFTGQVWVHRRGMSRWVTKSADWMTARLSTSILVDSASQREYLLRERVVGAEKSTVLMRGSVSGVDTGRFRPHPEARSRIRKELSIPDDGVVLLYVGRLHVDKGLLDLAAAFRELRRGCRKAHLLIVGPDEGDLRKRMETACGAERSSLRFVNFTDVPESYMAASDVFCLPSYREGFGSVIIEAAGAGLPAVASNIYGIADAIEDGGSGLLVEAGDVLGLARALERLVEDVELRTSMGAFARSRALRYFSQETVNGAVMKYYDRLLGGTEACTIS